MFLSVSGPMFARFPTLRSPIRPPPCAHLAHLVTGRNMWRATHMFRRKPAPEPFPGRALFWATKAQIVAARGMTRISHQANVFTAS